MVKSKNTKVQVEFAPGCFDNFEGSQEELDELVAEFTRMVSTGEHLEKSRPLDLDDLSEEEVGILTRAFESEINPRKLQ